MGLEGPIGGQNQKIICTRNPIVDKVFSFTLATINKEEGTKLKKFKCYLPEYQISSPYNHSNQLVHDPQN